MNRTARPFRWQFALLACAGCTHNLQFPKAPLSDAATGEEYSARLDLGACETRIGSAEVESGKLPPGVGVSFQHESAGHNLVVIQGVPRTAGTYKFTLGAWCKGSEADGNEAKGHYVLKVAKGEEAAGLHFGDDKPAEGAVGQAYEVKIPIGRCEGPFEDVDVTKGKLPAGLEAKPSEDEFGHVVAIKGTPKKAGTFRFTLLAACGSAPHSLDPGPQITHDYVIKITRP